MNTKYTWHSYARYYDMLTTIVPYCTMLDTVCHLIRPTDAPILDAGCGTGNLTRKLAHSFYTSDIVACDMSKDMLRVAEEKCASDTVLFKQLNLDEGLPFPDTTFGNVVCTNVLYAVPRPAYVLSEFLRVLRPDGQLIVVTPREGYENGLILQSHAQNTEPTEKWCNMHRSKRRESRLAHKALGEHAKEFLELIEHNREISHESSFFFFSPQELVEVAQETGFTDCEVLMTYAQQNILLTAYKRRRT